MSKSETKVTISCYGGCGRTITLRKSKVSKADYYLCHSRKHGHICEQKLPPTPPGMVRIIEINAAGSFWGYTYTWPDPEMAESLNRARQILAAGIAKLAIEEAKKKCT
jgi:hypothetical protein